MYEFGEELIIESYKVPWLIWIQLLVTILLLIVLLFGFSVFSVETSGQSSTIASSSATSQSQVNNNSRFQNINGSSRNTPVQEIETIKANAQPSTSREITTEQIQERGIGFRPSQHSYHPCHFLGLAKQALLKCLGLDSSDSSADRRHFKKD